MVPLCFGSDVMSSSIIFIGGRSARFLSIDFLSELLETLSTDSTVVVVVFQKEESCPPKFSTLPSIPFLHFWPQKLTLKTSESGTQRLAHVPDTS